MSFGWLAYLEVGRGSWICAREQVEAVGGSTFSVNGTITFLVNLIEKVFSTGCQKCVFSKILITFLNSHKLLLVKTP